MSASAIHSSDDARRLAREATREVVKEEAKALIRERFGHRIRKLAELAVSWFGRGCCGFDLAGEEAGHPPKHHVEAFQLIKRRNGSITIVPEPTTCGFLIALLAALSFRGIKRS